MLEGINGAGMAYQGSALESMKSVEASQKADLVENELVVDEIAKRTANISINETNSDGDGQKSSEQEKKNEQIRKAVEDINRKAIDSEAIYGIHEATNRVTIKIVDKTSRKVIKEIPPEKTLDMIAKAWELAGIMVDEKR